MLKLMITMKIRALLVPILFLLISCGGSSDPAAPREAAKTTGFLGCSLSTAAVIGYHEAGGKLIWKTEEADGYIGGSVVAWHDEIGGGLWENFSKLLESYPDTDTIWWMLCSDLDDESLTVNHVVEISGEIQRLAPGVTVYVSPAPAREGYVCSLETDMAVIEFMADQLIILGLALPGPELTPLAIQDVTGDLCHPNSNGQEIWGQDLLSFFGE